MLTCQAHLKVSILSCLLDVVYLEIVVFFYDFQGFGSIPSTQPTETHISDSTQRLKAWASAS